MFDSTIQVTEPVIDYVHTNLSIESRIIQLQGYFLDAGIDE